MKLRETINNLIQRYKMKNATANVVIDEVLSPKAVVRMDVKEKFDEAVKKLPVNERSQYHTDLIKLIWAIREKYHGVTPKVVDYHDLPKDEQHSAIFLLSEISKNKYFQQVLDLLADTQQEETAQRAPDMNAVSFGRATINGIELIRETLATAESELEDLKKKGDLGKDKLAKFKLIGE